MTDPCYTMTGMVTLEVFRWAPAEPERWQRYQVPAGPDTTVLDALVEVQRTRDPTLAFRYACRVGMCGSCAVVVNGRERWACRTRLTALGSGPVTVRPLYHFPLVRDLVVDLAPVEARLRAVGGAFVPRQGAASYASVPSDAAERRRIDEAIECIGCGICVSACTMTAHDPRFAGPAALNRAFTLQRDGRDGAGEARWPVLLSEDALWRCHGQANCTEVCPMGLSPTASIARLRRMATGRALKRLLRLAAMLLVLTLAAPAAAQRVEPFIYLPYVPPPPGAAVATWALPHEERRATIVASLPEPRRYRVCNESNTTAVVTTDAEVLGFDLPGRTCVDVAARTITVSQRVLGIPAYGTYVALP